MAKRAFLHYLEKVGIDPASTLTFQTQMVGQDNAIPDLVGVDAAGRPVVIAEAKFWAGLTDNQPLTYINRLPSDVPSVLLFIAPAMRFPTLWPELQQRCRAGGHPLAVSQTLGTEFVAARLSDSQTLALASWRSVLAFIMRAGSRGADRGPVRRFAASRALRAHGRRSLFAASFGGADG